MGSWCQKKQLIRRVIRSIWTGCTASLYEVKVLMSPYLSVVLVSDFPSLPFLSHSLQDASQTRNVK